MRYFHLFTLILLAACSSRGSSTFPTAFSPTLDGMPRGIKGTVFISSTGGTIVWATAPYTVWRQTSSPLPSLIPIALTKRRVLFAGQDTSPGGVYSFAPPYDGQPLSRGMIGYDVAMTVDPSDNVWVGADNNLYLFKAPGYSGGAIIARSKLITNPQGIVALPSGQIAVTAVKDNATGFHAGAVDIYTHSGSKFVLHTIKAVPYPQSLIVDRKRNLIVASCARCFSLGQLTNELALIAPPYTKVTRVITQLPNITTVGMAVAPNGDLFVIENQAVVRYPEPYSKRGHPTSALGALDAVDVDNAGNLIYSTGSIVYLLKPPYKGTPTQIYSAGGIVEQIITAQ